MKHKLSDLTNYLFDTLDELTNSDLTDAELDKAIRKSEAVANVADKIIHAGDIALKTMKTMVDAGYDPNVPDMLKLEGGKDD